MPKAKKPAATIIEVPAGESTVATVIAPTHLADASAFSGDAPDFIDIYENDTNVLVRQYSRQVHGDNFADLADSYLAGHPKCHKK
jgi:hypothetical protein